MLFALLIAVYPAGAFAQARAPELPDLEAVKAQLGAGEVPPVAGLHRENRRTEIPCPDLSGKVALTPTAGSGYALWAKKQPAGSVVVSEGWIAIKDTNGALIASAEVSAAQGARSARVLDCNGGFLGQVEQIFDHGVGPYWIAGGIMSYAPKDESEAERPAKARLCAIINPFGDIEAADWIGGRGFRMARLGKGLGWTPATGGAVHRDNSSQAEIDVVEGPGGRLTVESLSPGIDESVAVVLAVVNARLVAVLEEIDRQLNLPEPKHGIHDCR